MKCTENCATAYTEERETRQLWWAEPNLLPDKQVLKRDLVTHHHFAIH